MKKVGGILIRKICNKEAISKNLISLFSFFLYFLKLFLCQRREKEYWEPEREREKKGF